MSEADAWDDATWEGNRLRQHREFHALPFREKLLRLEQLAATARLFAAQARSRQNAGGDIAGDKSRGRLSQA
jgi:hypothetical protein